VLMLMADLEDRPVNEFYQGAIIGGFFDRL
jgi:hypothetical protein